MIALALGLVLFLGPHSIRILAEDARTNVIGRIGEGPWKGLYSLASIAGLALIVWGFAHARAEAVELWRPPAGMRHLTLLVMLASMVLLGGYFFKKSYVAVAVHHPMVWAVLVWSAAHLLANDSSADVLLFGAFFVWSGADLAGSYGRDRRDGVVYPSPSLIATAGAVATGLVFYGFMLGGLHAWLFS